MSTTMTMTSPSVVIEPIDVPQSDVDFGAIIKNIDIDGLSGKWILE